MEKKKLRKRKGQWVIVSMSVLASVISVSAVNNVANAQEVDSENQTSEYVEPTQNEGAESDNQIPMNGEIDQAQIEVSKDDAISENNELTPDSSSIETNASSNLEEETSDTAIGDSNETLQQDANLSDETAETKTGIESENEKETHSNESDVKTDDTDETAKPDESESSEENTSADEESEEKNEADYYTGKEYAINGWHDSQTTKYDLIAAVIAAETGNTNQAGIDAVTSTVFNRADNRETNPYTEITRPYQYSGYGGGSQFTEPWRKWLDYDLSLINNSLNKHKLGFRVHDYVNFLASDYFYDNGEWSGPSNVINDDLSPYVEGKVDIAGNTFFTPATNFPWKSSDDLEREKQEDAAQKIQDEIDNAGNYKVQQGQSLYSIARNQGITVNQLKKWNNLTSNIIHPGQYLVVNANDAVDLDEIDEAAEEAVDEQLNEEPTESQEDKAPEESIEEIVDEITKPNLPVYTIQRGDTLYGIAKSNGLSVDYLQKLNNLSEDIILPGQVLILSNEETTEDKVEQKPTNPAPSTTSYTVQRGDNLYRIATSNGMTLSELRSLNNLNGNLIVPGQKLKLTVNELVPETPKEEESKAPTTEDYTVQRGDTLYRIAQDNGLTLAELRELNNLTGDLIVPGQTLQLIVTEPAPEVTPEVPEEEQTPDEEPEAPTTEDYTVQRGDTLYRIAQDNGLTLAELRELNNLTGDLIVPGQTLQLIVTEPAPEVTPEVPDEEPEAPTTEDYTVQRGDTLYRIAQDNGLTLAELRELNNLTGDLIVPGQTLQLIVTEPAPEVPEEEQTPDEEPEAPTTEAYTVQRGDTLYKIAQDNGLTLAELRELNNLTGDLIVPGQTLQLIVTEPAPEVKPEVPEEEQTPDEEPEAPTTEDYTVKHGDTLYSIAQANGLSLAELRELNNLTDNLILPGQTLKLVVTETEPDPEPEETPESPEIPEEDNEPESSSRYQVQRGDNLYKIATENNMTVAELKRLNNLTSDIIVPGQQLFLSKTDNDTPNKPDEKPYTGDNLPDLSNLESRAVDYDIKLNGKTEPFRPSLTLAAQPENVVNYFGQRFVVSREFTNGSQTFLELTQNGQVVGYVPATAAVEVPRGKYTIYLDAGHGGSETGAYTYGTAEKNLNLNITNQLADRLRDQGYIVYETRDVDETVALRDRHVEPNRLMTDIYVSIHHNAMGNAGSAQGIEVLYHDPVIDEPGYTTLEHHKGTNIIPDGRKLAETLQDSLVDATGAVDRGTRAQNLWVVRNTDVPAVLVELGFQDHYGEYQKLTSHSYQQKLINGLVNGLNAYFTAK